MNEPTPERIPHRTLDTEALKGLSHPLRLQLIQALSTFGPATASGLAQRLGESSGATSYHLRQLEKHGFVREDATRGNARERWWERMPEGLHLTVTDFAPDTAERAIAEAVEREWDRARAALLEDYSARGPSVLPREWYEAAAVNTVNMQLTADELVQFVDEIQEIVERWAIAHKRPTSGSRAVQAHFNAFPVLGGTEAPEGDRP